MRMLRHISLLTLSALLAFGAPDARAQKVGSTSMQFLKVLPSARAAGMGEAYAAIASGAEAVFWNPAGLVWAEEKHGLAFTYTDWLFDSRQGGMGYALSLGGFGSVGLQFQYVDYGTFEETTNERPFINDPNRPGFTGRTFRPFSYVAGVSFSRFLTDRFSLGLAAKYAHESLFDGGRVQAQVRQGVVDMVNTSASGLLFDVGIRYATGFRTITIASAVQNFGSDVQYAVESYPVPLLFRVGIAADLMGPDALVRRTGPDNVLRAALDIHHPNDYAQQIHMGLEYEFVSVLSLRGGYKYNYDFDGLTLGAGLRYGVGDVGFRIDYSYGSMGTYLGSVHRYSLMMTFE